VRSAIVTTSYNRILGQEEEVAVGQRIQGESFDVTGIDINEVNARIVGGEGQAVARGRPGDLVDPSCGVVFSEQLAEGELVTEGSISGVLVDTLDVGGEDASLEVRATGGQEDTVGMPSNTGDGRLVLLDVLADPPIVILFEVADRDALGTAGYSEFLFIGRPLDVSGSAIDTQNYKSRLPLTILEVPYVGVTILRAGYQTVGLGSPIDTSHELIVFGQDDVLLPSGTAFLVDVHFMVVGAESKLGSISVPSVAGNASSELLQLR